MRVGAVFVVDDVVLRNEGYNVLDEPVCQSIWALGLVAGGVTATPQRNR